MSLLGDRLSAITLVVGDLEAARRFYGDTLELPQVHEDPDSVVFRVGALLVNLLLEAPAREAFAPASIAPSAAGQRVLLTVDVEDVDGAARDLAARGVTLLSGPVDRPWGVRTATFHDPAGHLWELAGPPRGSGPPV